MLIENPWGLAMAVLVAGLWIGFTLYLRFQSKHSGVKQELAKQLFDMHMSSLRAVIGLMALVWMAEYGEVTFRRMIGIVGLRFVQCSTAIAVLGFGRLAYVLKRRNQYRYGIAEIIFGTATSAVTLNHIDTNNFFTTLATLGGCVYVVARGFGNTREANDRPESLETLRLFFQGIGNPFARPPQIE